MDLPGIVEDTERARFCPQMDGWTDRWTGRLVHKVKSVYDTFNFVEAGV